MTMKKTKKRETHGGAVGEGFLQGLKLGRQAVKDVCEVSGTQAVEALDMFAFGRGD